MQNLTTISLFHIELNGKNGIFELSVAQQLYSRLGQKKRNVSGNPTDPVKNFPTLIFFSCFPKIKTRKSKKGRVFQVPDRQKNKNVELKF